MRTDDRLFLGFLQWRAVEVGEVRRIAAEAVAFAARAGRPEDREDLIQETLLDLWKEVRRPGFTPRGNFPALVRTIACRRCIDWRRHSGRRREVHVEFEERANGANCPVEPPRETADLPDQVLLAKERLALRNHIVTALRDAHRELIRLRVDEGLSYREIAHRQNRTETAVRRQWCDCLKKAVQIRRNFRAAGTGDGGSA